MNPDPTSLDNLHDVIAVPPAPWWPPAPGWLWALGALIVALVIAALWALVQWQRNAYRREALAAFKRWEKGIADCEGRVASLAAMAILLKQVALSMSPREKVASLTGPAWFAFLDRTGKTMGFSLGSGLLLESAAYRPGIASEIDETMAREAAALVRRWIRSHDAKLEEGRRR
jgi:Domain of unknown function (DUF4381)